VFDDTLSDALAAALARLADGCRHPAAVAARLITAGCTGERGSCDCCPVAAWLAGQVTIPDGARLLAGIDNAEIITGTGDGEQVLAAAPVPQVIASFIVAFGEEGLYPQLARPAGDAP